MTWVRFDDQFADSPKMEQVGPLAGWLHVAAICYSARHLLDGVVPRAKALRLTSVPAPSKRIRELCQADAWHEPGHTCEKCPPCPDGHLVIHDYLDYQPSRAEVEAERQRERDKKRRQRAKGTAAAGRDPDTGRYSPRESHQDTDQESPGDTERDSPGESPATRPDPTRTEEPTSPLATHHGPTPPGEAIIDQAVRLAARRYASHQVDQGKGDSVDGLARWWLQQNGQGARARATQLLAEYDLGAVQLADALGQPNPPWLRHHRRREAS